ncbi:MAG: type 1 glutamine amidotransferase [Gammaproteobacteria bacterium]|nr:type 1 glutamine amidotransferase [Gammaproteobacteria bacterium]
MLELRIGVIETGMIAPALAERFDDYPAMVAAWLGPWLPGARFSPLRVVRGEPLGPVHAYDGYVLTGSKHGVYERIDWIAALEAFVLACGHARIPVFGICFGHQLLAQAYGAKVRQSAQGWGCGVQHYGAIPVSRTQSAAVPGGALLGRDLLGEGRQVYVFHQDQVLQVPEDATLLGGNAFCTIGVLEYEACAFSVQFHPEFTREYMEALLDARAGVVCEEVANAARLSLRAPVDNEVIARAVAQLFKRAAVPADFDF